jgi:hypothetical protein
MLDSTMVTLTTWTEKKSGKDREKKETIEKKGKIEKQMRKKTRKQMRKKIEQNMRIIPIWIDFFAIGKARD